MGVTAHHAGPIHGHLGFGDFAAPLEDHRQLCERERIVRFQLGDADRVLDRLIRPAGASAG